ncbi:MAG: hypothetical protein ACK4UO_10475 [Pseudolabrys sp.]
MRLIFGIILGAILTMGGAFLYDSHHATTADTRAAVQKPLVNWDVVSRKWDGLAARARAEWQRLRADAQAT